MNTLNDEVKANLDGWKAIGVECFVERKEGLSEVIRAYLCSKTLGGTLAVNNGDGWIPVYPEKPNYPIRGNWYAPSWWIPKNWRHTVIAALDPEGVNFGLSGGDSWKRICIERSNKLRDNFRAQFTIAMIKGLEDGE